MVANEIPRRNNEGIVRWFFRALYESRMSYLMVLPAVVVTIIFSYIPMYGVTLAFKDYSMKLGILGSPWNGFKHFERLFALPEFRNVLLNTMVISLGRIVFEFPVPLLLALLLNEMRQEKYKKFLQTVFTLPHFLSWVVLTGVLRNFLRYDGTINQMIAAIGLQPVSFLNSTELFKPMLFITNIWKEAGWSVIIYMATITGIDPTLYEAAVVDGANRFQKVIHVTLPAMRGIILLSLLMALANVMNAGFEQIFNLMNPLTEEAGQIIDTYIYKITFQQMPNFGFSTAVGLFKGIINCVLLLTADKVVRRVTGRGLYVE